MEFWAFSVSIVFASSARTRLNLSIWASAAFKSVWQLVKLGWFVVGELTGTLIVSMGRGTKGFGSVALSTG